MTAAQQYRPDDDGSLVIEYSLDGGEHWRHGKTVEGWVGHDRTALAGQREAVREQARADHGHTGSITVRVLPIYDDRAVINQPVYDEAAAQVEAVLNILAPVSEGLTAVGLGPPVRVPVILLDYEGGPVQPNDEQLTALVRQIVTAVRTASGPAGGAS